MEKKREPGQRIYYFEGGRRFGRKHRMEELILSDKDAPKEMQAQIQFERLNSKRNSQPPRV